MLFGIGCAAAVRIGRHHRGTTGEQSFRRAFALVIPAFTLPLQVTQLLPGDWSLGTSLPLQLATWRGWPRVGAVDRFAARAALTYYWGLTLTTQAIITPALGQAFPHPRFFAYWGMHFLVVWAAVYLTAGVRIVPTWAGYRFAVACTAVWAAVIFCFNAVAGTNYGYLNAKPSSASVLDLLGPWPWYVAAEIALLLVVWALITWPWTESRRRVEA